MLQRLKLFKPIMSAGFASKDSPNIAVILAGCGVNDGSEIHEAVAVLSHITRNGAKPHCFAPAIDQMHVIDHAHGKEEPGKRDVLVESARISRGEISSLSELIDDTKNYDALIIPGGFGVAKNLSDFAVKGPQMSVDKEVNSVICAFHKEKKPLGFCCIAPILAAKIFPGVCITLGKSSGDEWPYKDAIEAAQKLGAKTVEKDVSEVAIDESFKVYSTPAFMYAGKYHEIDDGIGNLVSEILKALKK